jgi:putative addiction module killer protein
MRGIPYNTNGYKVVLTEEFISWQSRQTIYTQKIINSRLDRIAYDHFGDIKIFEGLIELRWRNGLRIYSFIYNRTFIVLLCGGNKNGQSKDIRQAKKIKEEIINGLRTFK